MILFVSPLYFSTLSRQALTISGACSIPCSQYCQILYSSSFLNSFLGVLTPIFTYFFKNNFAHFPRKIRLICLSKTNISKKVLPEKFIICKNNDFIFLNIFYSTFLFFKFRWFRKFF